MSRFKIGDLVYIRPHSPAFPIMASSSSLGIVKSEARLLYVHDWETEEVVKEFWAYEVLVEGQIFKNVPEDGLIRMERDDSRKNDN